MRCQPLSRKSRNRCASSARTSALNTSLISGSDEALVSARRGQVAVRPKEGVANVRRSAALAGWPSARCKPGRSFSSYRWSKASGSIGVNTPLCVLSQVYLPATGGVMTNGELVATAPTSRSLTMTGSNRSSKVMAGVGVARARGPVRRLPTGRDLGRHPLSAAPSGTTRRQAGASSSATRARCWRLS